jgi:signal transduction histidine kinase
MSPGSRRPTKHATENQQLRRLSDIGRALTHATSLEQVAQLAVERGVTLLEGTAAVLMLPDPDGQYHVRAAHGVDEERLAQFRTPLDADVVERLQGLLGVPNDAFIAVPLVAAGSVTGLLAVALYRASTPADEWLLSALADQAAVWLENARLGGEVRIEMEDRLRASQGATNAKDRALATLAHDIRSPLGAIDGYCHNLEDELYGPINPGQREALTRVRMSGAHLMSLLDNVMDMVRIDAGAIRVHAQPVALTNIARQAVHMLLPTATTKGIALKLHEAQDTVVIGDGPRIRQVLINLLGNSVKFTPAGGSIVVSTARPSIDGSPFGEIRVTDTGPGIADHEQRAIFEPYYRSDSTAMAPGVGLGLAISHALVKQMGGELTLESTFGVGSTFIIRFPAMGDENAVVQS